MEKTYEGRQIAIARSLLAGSSYSVDNYIRIKSALSWADPSLVSHLQEEFEEKYFAASNEPSSTYYVRGEESIRLSDFNKGDRWSKQFLGESVLYHLRYLGDYFPLVPDGGVPRQHIFEIIAKEKV